MDNQPLQEQKPKKKSRKVLWIVLGVIVLLIIIGVASSGGNSTPTKVGETNTNTVSTSTQYKVGDVIKIGDYTLTVNKATRNWQSPADYDKPEAGKEYVLVEVTITNEGKSSASYNTETFTMADNKLNSGSLAAGGKITGNLVYDVPQDDAGLKLLFNPTFWSQGVVINL